MPRPTHIPLTLPRARARAAFGVACVIGVHAAAVAAFVRGGSVRLAVLAAVLFAVRAFVMAIGYHRLFAHRAYATGRGMQLVLALVGTTAAQGGVLWWAGTHRERHLGSGAARDLHSSAAQRLASYVGFFLSRARRPARLDLVPDLAGYPELRVIDRWSLAGPLATIALLGAFGGVDAVLWGFGVSTCALLHATFTVDAFAHDEHNDPSYHLLRGLARLGLVWDVRRVSTGDAVPVTDLEIIG